MSESRKFDPKKLERLNNPERVKILNPDLIWETLNLSNPEVLVDIGAGTGFFATYFCKKMQKGTIYACDTSDVMISWMKENIQTFDNCSIIPTKCEETYIPIEDNKADLVYLINVFHELENPENTLLEAYRLLKPEGKIAIIDWKKEKTLEGPPLSHRVNEYTIFESFNNTGFSNIKSHNILPYHYFLTAEKI